MEDKHFGRSICKIEIVHSGTARERDIDLLQTYAPTASRESTVAAINVMINNNWPIHTMDVEKAFLQGKRLERELLVIPPEEAGLAQNTLWRLKTAAYGLTDAAQHWYQTFKSHLLDLGLKCSTIEPAIFYLKDVNSFIKGRLVTHVDDFLFAGNEEFTRLMSKTKIKIGSELSQNFKFCGMNIQSNEDGSVVIHLDDSKDNPVTIMTLASGTKPRTLSPAEKTTMRSKIGQLQ